MSASWKRELLHRNWILILNVDPVSKKQIIGQWHNYLYLLYLRALLSNKNIQSQKMKTESVLWRVCVTAQDGERRIILITLKRRQKEGDLTQSHDKSPYTNGNVKRAVTTQTTPQKSSIKQRLRTDLGRSVGVTTATQLVWLTWFTGPTFPLPATAV